MEELSLCTLLLGATGLTGGLVLQQLLGLRTYLPLLDLKHPNRQRDVRHHICIVTRSQLNLEQEVQEAFARVEESDLVEWECVFEGTECNEIHYSITTDEEDCLESRINVFLRITLLLESDSARWAETIPSLLMLQDTGQECDLCVVSCLGSTSASSRQSGVSREWVDRTLTLDILKAILQEPRLAARLSQYMVMTSFNNFVLSRMFPYFRAKRDLEKEVIFLLKDHRTRVTILRPGPLIGKHGYNSKFVVPELDDHLVQSIMKYKQALLAHYWSRIKGWNDVGIATKASEIVAQVSYNMPGAFVVGYPVKAKDCANLMVSERINHFHSVEETKRVRILSSQQIDSYSFSVCTE